MNTKVSIIIPVYNTGAELEQCIESLLHQSYNDLEIVLVNDASSDNSSSICERYVREDSAKFKYVEHKVNKGQSTTRNDGIRTATGNWMLFLDSDDTLAEDAIEKMVEVSIRDNVDIVLANYKTYNDQGVERSFAIDLPEGKYTTKEFVSHLFDEVAMYKLSCIGTKLYRMDFIRNKKKETPDSLITNYDTAFILDALVAGPSLSYLNKVVYIYYQRECSITHTYRKNMYKGLTQARKEIVPLLQKCGCYENKKVACHDVLFSVISSSLDQEVRFKRGYKNFKNIFTEIRNNPDLDETINVLRGTIQPQRRVLLMRFLKQGNCMLAYLLFWIKINLQRNK